MKRILIFSVAYHPFVGGAEIAVKNITDRMAETEFDMITLNLDGNQIPIEKIGNVTVHRINGPGKISKLLFPFVSSRLAGVLHAEKKYDAVWSIMASFSGFGALFFKKKHPDVPFVLTLQEGDPIDYIKHQVRFVSGWFKQIFTKADYIQTISHYLARFAQDMGATCPVTVIPNGVDLSLFKKEFSEQEKTALKEQLHKSPQDTFLITTSRLVKKNAIGDVIEALSLLPENIQFLIIGSGKEERMLRDIARSTGVEKRVQFLGTMSYEKLPLYLSISDIFVRPSLSEGMGNSFIEAMAVGIPVIGTQVGGIPDFLTDSETGLFARVRDPQSIADKVQLLLNNRELKKQLVTNAVALVTKEYDWNLIAERMKSEIFAKV